MRRYGKLLVLAALGAVLVASGPAFARMGGGGFGGGHMGGGGGHFSGFAPRFAGRSGAMSHFDHRFFDRDHRFRRFGRFDRDDRFFFRRGFRRGLLANGFWGLDGGWSYPDWDNATSGYNYPSSDNSYSTGSADPPLVIRASLAPAQPCIISVKACQLHKPPFAGSDCSCRIPGGASSEVP